MDRPTITAIVLCGGRATRLGGVDKPLTEVGDKTLLGHVIDRVRPQVDELLLSCAQTTAAYEAFGHPVVADQDAGQGPLGGFVSALARVRSPWVFTTPADTPFLPDNLVASLAEACETRPLRGRPENSLREFSRLQAPLTARQQRVFVPWKRTGAAVVAAGGHRQNLTMLLDAEHAQALAAFYEDGGRAIHRWLVAHAITEVDFPVDGFLNVNTPEDLAVAEARYGSLAKT